MPLHDTDEWKLFEQELRKITLSDVQTYLVAQGWTIRPQTDRRFELYHREESHFLLPIDKKLSDFYFRFADALAQIAKSEHLWMPRLVFLLLQKEKDE